MKKLYTFLIFTTVATFLNLNPINAQITVKRVNPNTNPLVDSLVKTLVGRGVAVQNIKSNLKETSRAIGTFKDRDVLTGIRSGLVITNGIVDSLPKRNRQPFNPNAPNPSPGGNVSATIAANDTIAGASTGRRLINRVLASFPGTVRRAVDVATIEFEIIPATDSLEFRYVFFSEEYPEYVCSSFNDFFGFFITGPGIQGDANLGAAFPNTRNLARIPGTNIPITINNVNNGLVGGSGTASNCNFPSPGTPFYRSNSLDTSSLFENFVYDGLTKVITAKVKVIPCQVYRLIFTVADVNDGSLDSGVMIEAGSLKGTGVVTNASSDFSVRFPYMIIGCNDGKYIFKRCTTVNDDSTIVRFNKGGDAVNGVDYVQLLPDGSTKLLPDSFVLKAGKASDSIVIRGLDNPTWANVDEKSLILKYLSPSQPYINGVPNFNGEETKMRIRKRFIYNTGADSLRICPNNDTSITPITPITKGDKYRWRELVNKDTIIPTNLSCIDCRKPKFNIDSTKRFVVFVTDSSSGCVASDTLLLRVFQQPTAEISTSTGFFSVCEQRSVSVFGNPPSADPTWKYQWTKIDPANQISGTLNQASLNIFKVLKTDTMNLRITNVLGCYLDTSVIIRVALNPKFTLPVLDTLCGFKPITITPINLDDTIGGQFIWTQVNNGNFIGTSPILEFTPTQSTEISLAVQNACTGVAGAITRKMKINVRDSIRFTPANAKPVCLGDSSTVLANNLPSKITFSGWFSADKNDSLSNKQRFTFKANESTSLWQKSKDVCYLYWKKVNLPIVPTQDNSISYTPVLDEIVPYEMEFSSLPLGTNAAPFVNYNWKLSKFESNQFKVIDSSKVNPFKYNFDDPAKYTLQVVSKSRTIVDKDTVFCPYLAKTEFEIKGDLVIPNLVTINNDALNEYLKVKNLRKNISLIVFNRWGKEVFNSKGDYKNDFNAEGLSGGQYYYLFKDNKKDLRYGGWFEITK